MFYSKSTGGFYSFEIHGNNIPSDVVEITVEQWQELLAGPSQGKVVAADESGYPVLKDAPQLTYAQLRASEYPSIGDQLDALWKGGGAAAEMLAQVQAVKAKYPKV